MVTKKLLTTDRQVFLDAEFKDVFSRVFKSPQEFEKKMQEYLMTCVTCNSYYWLDCDKRCECDFKIDNHAYSHLKEHT